MQVLCKCPYCGHENKFESENNNIFLYPLSVNWKKKYDPCQIFFWKSNLPDEVNEESLTCINCGNTFYIQAWPPGPLLDIPCNEELFLEKMVNHCYKFINSICYFRISSYLLLNIILVFGLFFLFIIIPSIISGSIEALKYDYGIFVTPWIFVLLLTAFMKNMDIIHNSFNWDVIPIDLDEDYKKTVDYKQFKEKSLKCFFFGEKSVKGRFNLSPPFFCGLLACVIGFRFFVYFLPQAFTFYEVITPDQFQTHVYTSFLFNAGYLFFHIPFWFTIGTVVWISITTPNLIARISNNIPLKINPLQNIGGTEVLGKILFKSNLPLGILALGVPVYIYRNQYLLDPTWIYYNIFLMFVFIIIIFFSFFHPLYPIHKKMKIHKMDEINDLTEKIDYPGIKSGQMSKEEIDINLLRMELLKRIGVKNEWPFNSTTLFQIITLSLIPITQLILSLVSLMLYDNAILI